MKHCAFYHKETGILHPVSVLLSDDSALAANVPPDHVPIDQPPEGPLDMLSQRIDVATGKVVDYQPPAPSDKHVWNASTKRWELSAETRLAALKRRAAAARIAELEVSQARAVREHLLGNADAINRLRAIDDEISALRASLK